MDDEYEPRQILIGGELFRRVTATEHCPDCDATRGQLHTTGCDQERCPRCSKQIYTCGCPFDDE
jgi:hypothetical protein